VLVEARAVFLRRLPGSIPARPSGGLRGVDEGFALAALDLLFAKESGAEGPGGHGIRLRVVAAGAGNADDVGGEEPSVSGGSRPGGLGEALLLAGEVWRLGVIRGPTGEKTFMEMTDGSDLLALREAFAAGAPVSVLAVTYLGPLHTDRIDAVGDGEG
jgi:hypothetical protein